MTAELKVCIVTPLGIILEQTADFVVVPTLAGVITIYPNHAPLISAVHTGECEVSQGGLRASYAVFNGVAQVTSENGSTEVTLLVDRSEEQSLIDVARAEEAVKRAQELKAGLHQSDVDFARFEALIDKELNRVRVARKYRN